MDQKNKYYLYVLECNDSTLYTGYTNDVERRVAVHNSGKGAKYTKARVPVTCVFHQQFETKSEAMKAEYAFKKLTRKQKLDYIRSYTNENSKK
jgi:putative endonuclease